MDLKSHQYLLLLAATNNLEKKTNLADSHSYKNRNQASSPEFYKTDDQFLLQKLPFIFINAEF